MNSELVLSSAGVFAQKAFAELLKLSLPLVRGIPPYRFISRKDRSGGEAIGRGWEKARFFPVYHL